MNRSFENRRSAIVSFVTLIISVFFFVQPATASDDEALHKSWESANQDAKQAFESGNFQDCETHYRTALDYADKLDSSGPKAISSHGLAKLYHKQGKYKEAEPLYKTALAIFDGSSRRRIFYLYSVIQDYADMLTTMGRTQEAQELKNRLKPSTQTQIR